MAFVLHEIVENIYAAYEALPGGREPLSRDENGRPQFGNLEKARNAAVGKVVWMLQRGSRGAKALQATVTTDEAGNEVITPSNHEALCQFLVWCWVPSLEVGWNLMEDLTAVISATTYGQNIGLQNFTIPTELEGRELHAGTELFVLDLTLSVPLRAEGSVPLTRVPIESHQSTVTEDNGEADEDGNFEAFETVVVTGPPTP
jgi:hypothetical protein